MGSQQELISYPVVMKTCCLLTDEQFGVLFVLPKDVLALLAHISILANIHVVDRHWFIQ